MINVVTKLVRVCGEHLVELRLDYCKKLTTKAFASIAKCSRLKLLSLEGNSSMQNTDIVVCRFHNLCSMKTESNTPNDGNSAKKARDM